MTKDETLSELERTGWLFLAKTKDVDEGYYIVQMPFVQLKLINAALANTQLGPLFPNDLLLFPSKHRPVKRDDFKLMLSHFHSTICRAMGEVLGSRYNGRVSLKKLLRGSQGSEEFLETEIRLDQFGVFHESEQYPLFFFIALCWSLIFW